MPDVPPNYRSDFASETPTAAQELEILKDDIRKAAAVADPRPFSQGIGVDFRDKAPSAADDTHEEWGARLDFT